MLARALLRAAEAGVATAPSAAPGDLLRGRFRGLAWGLAAAQYHRLGGLLDLPTLAGGAAPRAALAAFVPPSIAAADPEQADRIVAAVVADGDLATPGLLGAAYEELLGHDVSYVDGSAIHERGNRGRRAGGAFYTPPTLARRVAEQALDALCERRLGALAADVAPEPLAELCGGLRVADLSCGGGAFFGAWLDVVEAALRRAGARDGGGVVARAAAGLHGVAGAPRALLAARADLAVRLGSGSWYRDAAPRFRAANPLLPPGGAGPAAVVEAFARGLIYHPDLAPPGPLPTFDVVLGNPPWEKVRLEERSLFKPFAPDVGALTKKAPRTAAIRRLEHDRPDLFAWYEEVRDGFVWTRERIKDGRFPDTAVGELDTYALFTELALSRLRPDGVAALVVKSGLVTTPRYRRFFARVLERRRLLAFWDIENREKLFPIDSRERYGVLLLGDAPDGQVRFAMGSRTAADVRRDRLSAVPASALRVLNPLTGMLPNTSDETTLRVLVSLCRGNPAFDDVYPDANFGRIVHLTSHSELLHQAPGPDRLDVLEGKFIEQYDGRFTTFEGVPAERRYVGKAKARLMSPEAKADPEALPEARHFVGREAWTRLTRNYPEPWSLMWRNTTSASNRRSCLATLLPHGPGVQSVQLLQLPGSDPSRLARLLATMNSLPFDWMVRKKLVGIDLTQKVVRQVPVIPADRWSRIVEYGGTREVLGARVDALVASLIADDARTGPLCARLGVVEPAADRRRAMRDLDRLTSLAYGIDAELLGTIATAFPSDLTPDETASLGDVDVFPRFVPDA